jgi:hypothetical protein
VAEFVEKLRFADPDGLLKDEARQSILGLGGSIAVLIDNLRAAGLLEAPLL